jgi:hypothetical protein
VRSPETTRGAPAAAAPARRAVRPEPHRRRAGPARRVGVMTGILPDPSDPEAGFFGPGDLARLVAALAVALGIFAAGLVLAVLFTPAPLTGAVPWWVPFPVAGVPGASCRRQQGVVTGNPTASQRKRPSPPDGRPGRFQPRSAGWLWGSRLEDGYPLTDAGDTVSHTVDLVIEVTEV